MKGSQRNKPCECGSGKKSKLCLCWQIDLAHEQAIFEDEYREYLKFKSGGSSTILSLPVSKVVSTF